MLWNIISLSLYNQAKQGTEGWSTEAKAKGKKKKSREPKNEGPAPSETAKALNFAAELNYMADGLDRYLTMEFSRAVSTVSMNVIHSSSSCLLSMSVDFTGSYESCEYFCH